LTATSIGLIVENASDEVVVRALLDKVAKQRFSLRRFHSRGCGNLQSKCAAWARDLMTRGCRAIVVVQDVDDNDVAALRLQLDALLAPLRFSKRAVVIPVREIEAWLLADEIAIKKAFSLKRRVRPTPRPEAVQDPKQLLTDLVAEASEKRVTYVNSIHNARIAVALDVSVVERKCASVVPLLAFGRGL
jgi:hypothetical protein